MRSVLRLSFSLAKTNFKLRNEGSYLGILWYILSPLLLFLILLFVKQEAFSVKNIPYYPIYLLSGLLLFNLFTQIIGSSIVAISSNAGFIKSIKIPMEALVVSKAIQFLFSHVFEIFLLGLCMFYIGLPLVGLLLYVPVLILFILFLLGLSFIVSTIGVYISDLNNVWTVFSQLLFFVTPIFYVPQMGNLIYQVNEYNPLYFYMRLAREVLIGGQGVSFNNFIFAGLSSFVVLFAGIFIFAKNKYRFAEHL
ncbi:MAG: ABC transporter permease [Candidatus Pacebacteria bacterium]|nr:ABC transporter permease [Candidatus Paceibacterota bacterium]